MLNPELEAIGRTLQPSRFPKKLALELSAECNLTCTMCHHPFMCRPKGAMPAPLWEKCADEVAMESPSTEIWFSFCGEPLLEADRLVEFIRYGKKAGLQSINVNTNGQLLTPQVGRRLLESGLDLVVVGIDGYSREVFESIRVGADRDTVYQNVLALLAERDRMGSGMEVQVQFIEMDENEHDLEDFTAFWLGTGATLKVRNKLSWGGTFETPLHIPDADRIPCPWALTMMHVFWDGRVPRCSGDTEGEDGKGNAWEASLVSLWADLAGYRDLHLSRRFDALPARCGTCKDWMTGAAERVRPGDTASLERRRVRQLRRRGPVDGPPAHG